MEKIEDHVKTQEETSSQYVVFFNTNHDDIRPTENSNCENHQSEVQDGTSLQTSVASTIDLANLWSSISEDTKTTVWNRLKKCADRRLNLVSSRRNGGSYYAGDKKDYKIVFLYGFVKFPNLPPIDVKEVNLDVRFSGRGRYLIVLRGADELVHIVGCRGYKTKNIGEAEFLPGKFCFSIFFELETGGRFFLVDGERLVAPFFSGSINRTHEFPLCEHIGAIVKPEKSLEGETV